MKITHRANFDIQYQGGQGLNWILQTVNGNNLFIASVEVSESPLLYMESITEQRLLDLFRVSAKSYQPIIIINGDSAND